MSAKPGRNAPCPCGSGKKYERCCLASDEAAARERSRQLAMFDDELPDHRDAEIDDDEAFFEIDSFGIPCP